jgi:hypothetical protein
VSVVFFANPFSGRIFATVVDRLLASVDRTPRLLTIIYFNPVGVLVWAWRNTEHGGSVLDDFYVGPGDPALAVLANY